MYVYRGKISFSDTFRDEALTVVFPSTMTPDSHVYLFSQLSTVLDAATDNSFVSEGIIKPSNEPDTIVFSLSHFGSSIDFSATLLANNDLHLRLGHGIIAQDLGTLSLIYHEPGVHPQIYKGKLDLEVSLEGKTHRAVNETLVVLSTHDGLQGEKLLCVLWQWTDSETDAANSRKINTHFTSPSYDSATPVIADGGFTFSLISDDKKSLMIENSGTKAKTEPLALLFGSNSVTVVNDTDYFVNVLAGTDTSDAQSAYARGGMLFAAFGIPFAFGSEAFGIAFAVASLAYASGGLLVQPPDPGRYSAMPPRGTLSYSSNGTISVSITRVKQDHKSIVIQIAKVKDKPRVSIQKDIGTWVDMLRVETKVLDPKKLVTRALFRFEGVKPSTGHDGIAVDGTNSNEDMGIYYTDSPISGDHTKMTYHGSLAAHAPYGGQFMLDRDDTSSVSILFTSQSNDNWSIHQLGFDTSDLILALRCVDVTWDTHSATEGEVYESLGRIYDSKDWTNFIASVTMAMAADKPLNKKTRTIYYVKNHGGLLYGMKRSYAKPWQLKLLPRGDSNYEAVYTILRFTNPAVLNATYQ